MTTWLLQPFESRLLQDLQMSLFLSFFVKWLTLLFAVADWDSMSHFITKTCGYILNTQPSFSNIRPGFSTSRLGFWFSLRVSKARPSVWKDRPITFTGILGWFFWSKGTLIIFGNVVCKKQSTFIGIYWKR